jgi:NADH-quinone oxidoreductase subunit E
VTVNCLGACALGPVLVLDGKYHGKATVAKADEVLAAAENRPTEGKP